MNAIYILWLRQVKRYIRSKSRMAGSIGQPILFLIALGFGFGPIYAKAGGGDYLKFLTPGVISMGILFTGIFSGIDIIWDKQFGFLKETLVAPVSRINIMIGRTLGGATIAIIQGIVIFIIALIVGFRPVNPALIPTALIFIAIVAILFTALGTAVASILKDMQGFQLIMNFLVMPLFFFSGALFPLQDLPEAMEVAARLDPLSYSVDGLRTILVGETTFGLGMDFLIILGLTAILLGIGSYLFSKIEI